MRKLRTDALCHYTLSSEIEKIIIRQPPIGEKDDYDSENSWISDGLPSSSIQLDIFSYLPLLLEALPSLPPCLCVRVYFRMACDVPAFMLTYICGKYAQVCEAEIQAALRKSEGSLVRRTP